MRLRFSKLFYVASIISVTLASLHTKAEAAQITVPVTSNIYGAGKIILPNTDGGGSGTFPPVINLPTDSGVTITFISITGTVDYGPTVPDNGPDGSLSNSATPLSLGGLAGVAIGSTNRALLGVFLSNDEPSDPAPSELSFPTIGFTELSPGLNQIFFIGDGKTGTGSGDIQQFNAPTGATRLFLGFYDGLNTGGIGFYGDNSGELSVDFDITAVPTPALLPGLISMGVATIRRRKQEIERRA